MTNREILQAAMNQSAVDSNCRAEDFLKETNRVVLSEKNANARKYLDLPFLCDLTTYGSNIVASVSKELAGVIEEYINNYSVEHCFETPNLLVLMERLKPYDVNVCFMAEYFLPDADKLRPMPCEYALRVLGPNEFADCYRPEWSNALSEGRKELDRLAIGAFDHGKLVGLAGCSADCDTMWQIGVDVLPEYRRQGVASALTSRLAMEVLDRGIVPFYCCAWSNIKSARNAFRCGFYPAWAQITVKETEEIERMNRRWAARQKDRGEGG